MALHSPARTCEETAVTGEGNALARSTWHSWESPVGLGIAPVSFGIAFVSTGAALALIRYAVLGG